MAFELGFRPFEWEHLQPVEILAMVDARERRRNRTIAAAAAGLATLVNRIPLHGENVKPEHVAAFMAAADYLEDEV